MLKILLVESNGRQSVETQQRLECCGFQVFAAPTWDYALQLSEHVQPDVVITGMCSSTLVHHIKDRWPSMPIVTLPEPMGGTNSFHLLENRGNGMEFLNPVEWVDLIMAN